MEMEQRNKPEMDVEAMLLEQALRERVDAAFERLRNGTAVYLSHSEVEKRMAVFKKKIRERYRWGCLGVVQGWADGLYGE
ncbi:MULTISPECIES: hypothetical protein [Serratia]|uniref:hypothetical protein n=2 Tax=Serratia TaxID=613 RepID=UPI002B2625D2|nr:hypothetical protein [Serratia marcescens]WPJ24402.1 hypothetical protein NAE95_02165 [Serratia marcescens]